MGIEKPKQPTPKEQAELEKSRTISDAEFLKGGAEYKINEETGEKQIRATESQIEDLQGEIGDNWIGVPGEEIEEARQKAKKISESIENQHIYAGDLVDIHLLETEKALEDGNISGLWVNQGMNHLRGVVRNISKNAITIFADKDKSAAYLKHPGVYLGLDRIKSIEKSDD